jgi:hypothetical protein
MCCFVPRLEGVPLGIAGTLEERWGPVVFSMGFSHVSQPKMRQMPWVFYGWYIFPMVFPLNQSDSCGFHGLWDVFE